MIPAILDKPLQLMMASASDAQICRDLVNPLGGIYDAANPGDLERLIADASIAEDLQSVLKIHRTLAGHCSRLGLGEDSASLGPYRSTPDPSRRRTILIASISAMVDDLKDSLGFSAISPS